MPATLYGLPKAASSPGVFGLPGARAMSWAARVSRTIPVVWWRLSDAVGATALVDNMVGRSLTLAGSGTTLSVPGATKDGAFDLGVTFNGSGSGGASGIGALPTGSAARTLVLFLKWTSSAANYTPWSYGSAGNLFNILLSNASAGSIGINLGASGVAAFGNGGYNDGKWHLVMVSYAAASTTLTMYIDNANLPVTASVTALATGTTSTGIGRDEPQSSFNYTGSIDETVMFDRVLTATERALLYAGWAPF